MRIVSELAAKARSRISRAGAANVRAAAVELDLRKSRRFSRDGFMTGK
jgi:hypothetical protein